MPQINQTLVDEAVDMAKKVSGALHLNAPQRAEVFSIILDHLIFDPVKPPTSTGDTNADEKAD